MIATFRISEIVLRCNYYKLIKHLIVTCKQY